MTADEPEATPPLKSAASTTLSLTIKDKAVLYATYMPYIKQGGLFIPTTRAYKLGDEVDMILNIMDDAEKLAVSGKVVWLTPSAAQGNRAPGIGVQFQGKEGVVVRNKIETYLAGALQSDRPTHTM